MINYYKSIIYLTFSCLAISNTLDYLPSDNYSNWKKLNEGKVSVWYSEGLAVPWCKASTIYPFSSEQVYLALKDLSNYKNIFERVTESQILDDDVVYIRLDMPLFLADRDYTVKYIENKDKNNIIFQFYSIKHPNSPDNKGSVTLPRASGKWSLTSLPGGATEVIYIWNGELLGNFPGFYLTTAWETQGGEIIEWLNQALEK